MNSKITNTLVVLFLFSALGSSAAIHDSIGIMDQNGKKMILHQVGKETLYSISRRYNVSVNDIKSFNPEIEKGLKLGQKILIPLVNKQQMPASDQYVLHKIEPNQTLYAVSKKYNVKVDDIKRWNNMTSNDMKVGSLIIVGEKLSSLAERDEPSSAAPSAPIEQFTVAKAEVKPTTTKQIAKASGYDKATEKGNAEAFEVTDGNSFYYALHRNAPVGTIVRIVNDGNGNSIFARVIGKLPSDADAQTVVRLTKIALERLQVDKICKASVEYVQ